MSIRQGFVQENLEEQCEPFEMETSPQKMINHSRIPSNGPMNESPYFSNPETAQKTNQMKKQMS